MILLEDFHSADKRQSHPHIVKPGCIKIFFKKEFFFYEKNIFLNNLKNEINL